MVTKRSSTDASLGGVGLLVAMGLGRFFYTPLLAIMLGAGAVTAAAGSWIATANYVGYFVGAFALARRPQFVTAATLRGALGLTALALVTYPLLSHPVWWAGNRLVGGVASAVAFVCVTRQVGRFRDSGLRTGIVYGGVGTGIALSGVLVLIVQQWVTWPGLWCVAGVAALAGTLALWRWPVAPGAKRGAEPPAAGAADAEESTRGLRLLQGGYFFEGLGYIIIGTFLVEAARPIMGERAGLVVWIIAGCAAAPSTAVWARFAERWGTARVLLGCYGLQVIGSFLPVVVQGPAAVVIAAALFGATFMGITMLSISWGADNGCANASARLTTWYSVGQIVGPGLVALFLAENMRGAFALAGVGLVAAMAFSAASIRAFRGAQPSPAA